MDYFSSISALPVDSPQDDQAQNLPADGLPTSDANPAPSDAPAVPRVAVAEIVYVEDAPRAPLSREERQALAEKMASREAARVRKAQRYAERKEIIRERAVWENSIPTVTHVDKPVKIYDPLDSQPPPERRSVCTGNAVRIRSRGSWRAGIVSGFNADGSRIAISYRGSSPSWRRGDYIYTTIFPYNSLDWYPVRTRTIPGTARRGRPAKIDTRPPGGERSFPASEGVYRSSGYSYTPPTYGQPPYAARLVPSRTCIADEINCFHRPQVPAKAVPPPARRATPSKQRDYGHIASDFDPSRRFRFKPPTKEEDSQDASTPNNDYADKKLQRQKASYAKYEEFLDKIRARDPKAVFRINIVVDSKHEVTVNPVESDASDEAGGSVVPSLTSAVEYAATEPVAVSDLGNDAPRTAIYFDKVDDQSRFSPFFSEQELFCVESPGEVTYFTDIDEHSQHLFDQYLEFAMEDALGSSSESLDTSSFSSGSLSSSLSNSAEIDNDEILLRKSDSWAFADERLVIRNGEPATDSELLSRLNDGIQAPEDTGGFDISDLFKHFSSFASASSVKKPSRDVFAPSVSAEEASLVVSKPAPASTYAVLSDDASLKKVLQPELSQKNVTTIPDFEARRAAAFSANISLNAREVVFASEEHVTPLLNIGSVQVYVGGFKIHMDELADFLNPTGGFVPQGDDDEKVDDVEDASSSSPVERVSLDDLWRNISLSNLRVDTLIDKAPESPMKQAPKRDPLMSRKPKQGNPAAPVPAPARASPALRAAPKLRCDLCKLDFRSEAHLRDHSYSRRHRDTAWAHKAELAAIANYGTLDKAPGYADAQ